MSQFDFGFTVAMTFAGGVIGAFIGVLLGANVARRKALDRCIEALPELDNIPAEAAIAAFTALCG